MDIKGKLGRNNDNYKKYNFEELLSLRETLKSYLRITVKNIYLGEQNCDSEKFFMSTGI